MEAETSRPSGFLREMEDLGARKLEIDDEEAEPPPRLGVEFGIEPDVEPDGGLSEGMDLADAAGEGLGRESDTGGLSDIVVGGSTAGARGSWLKRWLNR